MELPQETAEDILFELQRKAYDKFLDDWTLYDSLVEDDNRIEREKILKECLFKNCIFESTSLQDAEFELKVTEAQLSETAKERKLGQLIALGQIDPAMAQLPKYKEMFMEASGMDYSDKIELIESYKQMIQGQAEAQAQAQKAEEQSQAIEDSVKVAELQLKKEEIAIKKEDLKLKKTQPKTKVK